jgi:uncharacterized protein Smg (DUF494 family)
MSLGINNSLSSLTSLFGTSSSATGTSGTGDSSKHHHFGEKLKAALESAGLSSEQVKSTLQAVDSALKGTQTSDSGMSAQGDALEEALSSAGLEDETVKMILKALNGGKEKGADSNSSSSATTSIGSNIQYGSGFSAE